MQWRIQDFPWRGRQLPTPVLFGENVCKNERIGSHKGRAPDTPPRSANEVVPGWKVVVLFTTVDGSCTFDGMTFTLNWKKMLLALVKGRFRF